MWQLHHCADPNAALFFLYSFYEVYNDVVDLDGHSRANWSLCQQFYHQTLKKEAYLFHFFF